MKRAKIIPAILLCGLLTLACSACSKECSHVYGEWETVTPVTCTTDGRLERFCTKCGRAEISTASAKGHQFSDWTDGDGVRERHCAICGYTETINQGNQGSQNQGNQGNQSSQGSQSQGNQGSQGNQSSQGSQSQGGQSSQGSQSQGGNQSSQGSQSQGSQGNQSGSTTEAVTAVYGSFDLYLNDCDGSRYKGSATRFSVNIGEGTLTPDNYCFYIPEYVSYVKFIGRLQGDPFRNTTFRVETRTSDLKLEFENVLIETNGTIFFSETRNINLTLVMNGEKCSFLNKSKAARGNDGAENKSGLEKVENGQDGSAGSPAFIVNGHCSLLCRAKQLVVKGGEGGDGGNGSWTGVPGKASGNGGNGGNGGAAFQAENTVEILVKDGSTASISGGEGGNGGDSGGSTAAWSQKRGSSGSHGSNGGTGCGSFGKLYE